MRRRSMQDASARRGLTRHAGRPPHEPTAGRSSAGRPSRRSSTSTFDADGDGTADVLVNVPPERSSTDVGVLICLDARGRERWRFTHGRAFAWRDREFGPTFAGRLIRPVVSGGRRYVLSLAWASEWLVRRDVERIFDFREQALQRLLRA